MAFREAYCPDFKFPHRKFVPQYVLIYGRASEFKERPDLNLVRAEMQREQEYHMTFDRLHPIKDHSQYMTVKYGKNGYRAISMPATLELDPSMAEYRSMIRDKEKVVHKTPYLSIERKEFLSRRFKYWDDWVQSGAKGIINMGDRE